VNVSCTKCGKRYVLSDDKVAGKSSVKIRCKECQNLISIDVTGALSSSQSGVGQPGAASSPSAVASKPAQSQAAVALAGAQTPAGRSPWEEESTRAMPAMDTTTQWHAMIAGVQQGPFDVKALMGKVSTGEVTLRTYLWKAGMGDWKRASDVPEVSPIFAGVSAGATATGPAQSVSQASRPVTRSSSPVARQDVAIANEMPSPEITRPKGGNVADALPAGDFTQPANQIIEAPKPLGQKNGENGSGAAQARGDQLTTDQPLNDLFGDMPKSEPNGVHEPASEPQEQATSGEVDPFAALGEAAPGEAPAPGEATKFFIAQAGVNKRNPPWKIALFALSIIGLPTAALYMLSTLRIVELPMVTRTNEDGTTTQESFFSAGGVSGLKDLLTGDAKRKEQEAEKREQDRIAAIARARAQQQQQVAAANPTEVPDEPIKPPKPVNPDLAALYNEDNGRQIKAPRDRDAAAARALSSSGLKDDVAAKVVSDNIKAFNLCIENALRRNPNLKVGSVTVTLTVGASGAVKGASITPKQHEGSDWGACLMQSAKRIVFPASDGETDVQVPLKVGIGV
jgi:hypothetical protein